MNSRTPLIAGNWKMYKTTPEAVDTARQLVELVADTADVEHTRIAAVVLADVVANYRIDSAAVSRRSLRATH